MRIFSQVKPEMSAIFRRIDRLGLGAQHHFIDDMLVVLALDRRENSVELLGHHRLAQGKLDADRLQKLGERPDLFGRGRFVDAIDERYLALLLGFRRRRHSPGS